MTWTAIGEYPNFNLPTEEGSYWLTVVEEDGDPAAMESWFTIESGWSVLDAEIPLRVLAFAPMYVKPSPYKPIN